VALRGSPYDAEIRRLALPALGALAADPLVSLIDTAFVGRLGTDALAALGVSAAVFGVAFALFNFLAYGTTPLVARAVGEGDVARAGRISLTAGMLALAIGAVAVLFLVPAAGAVVEAMGAEGAARAGAESYVRIRALALPAVMVITAAHGIFRGFQDTKTPLVVTMALNLVNLVLDPLLIFGFDRGLAGAAWATVAAQWAGAIMFVAVTVARRERYGLTRRRPHRADLRVLLGAGRALVMRTGALLAVLTLATAVAARVGADAVAAHQIMFQVWLFLSLVLDALAIAAQAMVGMVAARDAAEGAALSRRLLTLGLIAGSGLALALFAVAPWLPGWFGAEPPVVAAVRSVYPFLVLMQPLNALVFVLDVIVIGATDFAYLAWAMVLAAGLAAAVLAFVLPAGWGLTGVWWGVTVLMVARAAALARWHQRAPFSSSRGPSPASPAA
jgi:MATE family multidrug resistance protein